MPQLSLQQTSPMLHVLLPQPTLFGKEAKPQLCLVQVSPGGVQIPHVALQHTSPGAHVTAPHATDGGGCSLGAVCDAVGGGADGVATSPLLTPGDCWGNSPGPAVSTGLCGADTIVGPGGSAGGPTFVCRLRLWKTTSKPRGT